MKDKQEQFVEIFDSEELSDDERVDAWNEYLWDTDQRSRTVFKTESLDTDQPASEFGTVGDIIRKFRNLYSEDGTPACAYFLYDKNHVAQVFIPSVDIDEPAIFDSVQEGKFPIENLPEALQKIFEEG